MAPLMIFLGFGAFLLGLIVGSFLNVCIYRMPREESLVYPPSHCPKCYQPIRPEDNIPIVSWFLLRGRCRACGESISLIYPAVEFLTGLLFAFFFWRFVTLYMQDAPDYLATRDLLYYGSFYLAHMAFISALFVATVVDFKFLIIPDVISLPGAVIAVIVSVAFPQLHPNAANAAYPHIAALLQSLVGAAVGAGVIYGMGVAGKAVFGKDAMGFGDVKLMALIGAFLGWQMTLVVVVLSAFLGTVYGVIHLAVTGNDKIPYGPFLSAGAVVTLIFRPEIEVFLNSVAQTYRFLFHAQI
jgi:leader peptidase (prepilin peptidase) / N-methyltransferase